MFVITGGGTGIGRALAHALAARGKRVLIIGRNEANLKETARTNARIEFLTADVACTSGRNKITAHLQHQPRIDGLIHNAATVDPVARLGEVDEEQWREAMETNVNAPLFLTQALQAKITTGRVLHIGSGAAYFPIMGWAAYCTSKAALSMITRCLQLENNITATSVMPGVVNTDFIRRACSHTTEMDPEKIDFFNDLRDENRMLTTETVAAFLTWLLLDTDKAQYVSQEWDMYDTSHHKYWLKSPHFVPPLER